MGNVLIVSGRPQQEALKALVCGCGFSGFQFAASAGEARRMLATQPFELAVINTPLSDEFGRDLALVCVDRYFTGALLLVPGPQAEQVAAGAEKYGVFVLGKPVSKSMAALAVRMSRTAQLRARSLEEKNRRLLQKLDDMRLICRAKCLLIQNTGVSEEQAHHIIEKQAMDQRLSAREIARDIIAAETEKSLN